jgi:hypothetical protein
MIATEAMNDDTLVPQANAAIASGDERQETLLAPQLVPGHGHVRAHRDLPRKLDISSASRDVPVDRRDTGQRHQDRHSPLRDPSHFLVAYASLGHYNTSNRLESVHRSNSFPLPSTTGETSCPQCIGETCIGCGSGVFTFGEPSHRKQTVLLEQRTTEIALTLVNNGLTKRSLHSFSSRQ